MISCVSSIIAFLLVVWSFYNVQPTCGVNAWISPPATFTQRRRPFCLNSSSSDNTNTRDDSFIEPPFLAIVTEPDACSSERRMVETYQAIANATSTNCVSLVSVRLQWNSDEERIDCTRRAVQLTRQLVQLSKQKKQQEDCEGPRRASAKGPNGSSSTKKNQPGTFAVVCSSNLLEIAMEAKAHGIHVKERDLSRIPDIRQAFADTNSHAPILGTSTHSLASARQSRCDYPMIDYYFVGTCFLTASHPEKTKSEDLEGPELPGQILEEFRKDEDIDAVPKVLAIGGIDASNCDIPIRMGAQGVAVIRAVLQADDPATTVTEMYQSMARTSGDRSS